MSIVLKGSSPTALTAGILLLSRARSFGVPLTVEIVGDPTDITEVRGPAVVHSNVLASCGVGRQLGQGALVIVPGPATDPVLVCLGEGGVSGWFAVDSSGVGLHPATQAFVRLSRDPRPLARAAARQLSRMLRMHGVPPEPAVLDVAFSAPQVPLTRLALALRAGRAMTGEDGAPVTRWLSPDSAPLDPPDPALSGAAVLENWKAGTLQDWMDRLVVPARFAVDTWLEDMRALALEDGGRDLALVGALGELFAHLAMLPAFSMLPPPDAASDAVATGLSRVLGATAGQHDANVALSEVFRFLGGRFVEDARYPLELPAFPPPVDRMERWRWFTTQILDAADHADELWYRAMNPQN
jgi:hypothetical protein